MAGPKFQKSNNRFWKTLQIKDIKRNLDVAELDISDIGYIVQPKPREVASKVNTMQTSALNFQ